MNPFRSLLAIVLTVVAWSSAANAAALPDPIESGPTGLAIEYHVSPADRPALRQLMQSSGIKQFEKWKAQGIIKHYQLLFNRYVDSQNWDMMAFVTFNTFSDVARWKAIEDKTPAGLPLAALKLTKTIRTTPADLYFQGGTYESRPVTPKSVFLIIPYDYTVSTAEYIKYSAGYIVPQFDGWLGEGVIASYGIYLGRYAVDRHWSALLVLEYKDDAALGLREKTIAKVRASLRENPAWKAISDNKQNVRVGRAYIMADPLLP
ncbi:MAG: hypothetical protein ING66_07560 [Rhodocyclaceae bacterium]|nr:hypothetical protein [Rhodocyclaceae bacterium]MCA3059526.1 hypothetical protein [Rhodocyclaceae bacterium]MCA3081970.1 hypothetical protein [Rhodocyclaceae bacterium]